MLAHDIGARVYVTRIEGEEPLGLGIYLGHDRVGNAHVLLDSACLAQTWKCFCVPCSEEQHPPPDEYRIVTSHPIGFFYINETGRLQHKKNEVYYKPMNLTLRERRIVSHANLNHVAFTVANVLEGTRLVLATCAGFEFIR